MSSSNWLDASRAGRKAAVTEAPGARHAAVDALAGLPGIEPRGLPHGKLSLHEEFPDDVSGATLRFMSATGNLRG